MLAFQTSINAATASWFLIRFPDENLKVFQYHYDFLFPKMRYIALQFHFSTNKIYSVFANAKGSLKWWIFENLQLVAWKEKVFLILGSSLIRNSSLLNFCEISDSCGRGLITFSVAGIKTRGYNTYMLQW